MVGSRLEGLYGWLVGCRAQPSPGCSRPQGRCGEGSALGGGGEVERKSLHTFLLAASKYAPEYTCWHLTGISTHLPMYQPLLKTFNTTWPSTKNLTNGEGRPFSTQSKWC